MGRNRKKKPEEAPIGAPDWMVTFCDCMTLLLTFFVLLLSFSGFGEKTFQGIGASFADALPAIGLTQLSEQEAFHQDRQATLQDKVSHGSETRTLADTRSTNFMKEHKPLDFRNLKVFTISSNKMFWGSGTALTKTGHEILDAFSIFLRAIPNRTIISENGPSPNNENGFERSWAILDYLINEKGLKKEAFSISASSTSQQGSANKRMVEITLLERSSYE